MESRKYIRIVLNIVIPILTILFVVVGGWKLLNFFAPFAIGWVIALIANPVVHFLEKRIRLVRSHGSFVIIVGSLALVIFGLYFLIRWMIWEAGGFMSNVPSLYAELEREVLLAAASLSKTFHFIPSNLEEMIGELAASLGAVVGEYAQEAAAWAGGAVARTLPDILVSTVVILLSSYFFLAKHDELAAQIWKWIPESGKRYLRLLRRDVRTLVGGYFLAQFRIMFVVAIIMCIGLGILKVPYFILVAILIAFLDFLPMFGTGTVLGPWALIKLFAGDWGYAISLIVLYVITQAVRQLIQPKIVGDSIGLAPLPTLFLLYVGYKVKGLAGMIVAVPVGMLVIRLYEYGLFDPIIRNTKLLILEIGNLRKEE